MEDVRGLYILQVGAPTHTIHRCNHFMWVHPYTYYIETLLTTFHTIATMDALIQKHYAMQVVRVVDQLCTLNGFTWQLHGPLLKLLLSGKKDLVMSQPLEFVITKPMYTTGYMRHIHSQSPVETLTTNLNINGYTLVNKSPTDSKLEAAFINDGTVKTLSIILRNIFPYTFFTSDALVLDANGITIRSMSVTADQVNACKGVAVLDRLFELQDDIVRPDAILLPYNTARSNKEHNVSFLSAVNQEIANGFVKIKGANVDIATTSAEECPVCMERNTASIKLSCGHMFCTKCLQRILEVEDGPRCCLCRNVLTFVTKVLPSGIVM